MTIQFDLEQQMIESWGITNDLELILNSELEDSDFEQALRSLIPLYELKFDRAFKTFEALIAERATKAEANVPEAVED